jgi:hypothetical protein
MEVIKKKTRFQYERSLAARSVVERSDIYLTDQVLAKMQYSQCKQKMDTLTLVAHI